MIGFIICLILGATIGTVGGSLSWLAQRESAPWQNDAHTPKSASQKKKHTGKCDGDCANCPPHYGYRYGRWYYGHDHIEGCVFGGNKESGSKD